MMLYIHIPFCFQKCHYCDFLSVPASAEQIGIYIEALCKEIEYFGSLCHLHSFESVYIGGGTPNAVPAPYMKQLLETIVHSFYIEKNAEVSIECNPGIVDTPFSLYKEYGIKRLSIGLQSANNDELRTLGRIHTYEAFIQTYEEARQAGFNNINVDIMSALPGQSLSSLKNTIQKVMRLKPSHISAYSLQIESGTPFYEKYHEDNILKMQGDKPKFLPDEEEELKMQNLLHSQLKKNQYNRYEISNFSLEDEECKHNIGYWTRKPYIGLGLGAASFYDEMRFVNPRDFSTYYHMIDTLDEHSVSVYRHTEKLTKEDAMAEFFYLGLRMTKGIRYKDFYNTFHVSVESVYKDAIDMLAEKNLLRTYQGTIFLTEKGLDVSNYVLAHFLPNE